jgi:hypothetical protein
MLMPAMTKGSPFVRVGLSAPAIALVYAAVAYTFVTLGCMPLFSDVDFFGVRVTMFLLAALTGAALVLIVLACLNSLRVLRALRRRYRAEEQDRAFLGFGAAAVILAMTAFAGTVWMAWIFFWTTC